MTDTDKVPTAPKKHNWDKLNPQIKHEGREIILPGDPGKMPLKDAMAALARLQADEEQEYTVHEVIDAYPHDAAVAFTKAMAKLYGWGSPTTEVMETFFGKIEKPPQMLAVKTGWHADDVVQCPLGQFTLPGVEAPIKTLFWNHHDSRGRETVSFLIHGKIKKKDRHVVLELANETRRIVREESIYRGKPIRLSVSEEGNPDTNNPPTFLNVSDISEADVLFDADIQAQIETSILVPLKFTDACRKNKIPLKRGVLLAGPYGTGKSLTAKMAARVAELNGWTFVLLDKVQGLRAALEFANRYAPAVVFAEDIDRIAEHRDDQANDLINTIDGVVSKTSEIMVVLTTNFVEKLDPVILRPGRLDAVISLRAPDAATVERLVRYYAGALLTDGESLASVGKELEGQIPASIRECVERAKLGMIGRGAGTLVAADLLVAAQTMKNHLALLNRKAAEKTNAEILAESLHKAVNNGFDTSLTAIKEDVQVIKDHVT